MLVSSHLLVEVAQTVDDVVIFAGGRLVRQASLRELADEATPTPEHFDLEQYFLALTTPEGADR